MTAPAGPRSAPTGFEVALRRTARLASDRTGVRVDVYVAPMAPPGRGVAALPCQAAREALADAVRHARARRVALVVTHVPGRVDLVVEDDGVGGDPAAGDRAPRGVAAGGWGALRARFEAAGGALVVESGPGAGCRVHARLPVR